MSDTQCQTRSRSVTKMVLQFFFTAESKVSPEVVIDSESNKKLPLNSNGQHGRKGQLRFLLPTVVFRMLLNEVETNRVSNLYSRESR